MSAPLALFLLRRHLPLQLLCAVAPLLVGVVLGILQPTLAEQRAPLLQLVKAFDAFLTTEAKLLVSPAGTFSVPLWHPLTLFGFALVGAMIPVALPVGARTAGSLDLLLASPLTRGSLVRTVFFCGLPGALVMGFAPLAAIRLAVELAGFEGEMPWATYGALTGLGVLVVVFLSSLALLVSVTCSQRGRAITIYAVFMAGFLLCELVDRMNENPDLDWLVRLSPLGWYPVQEKLGGEPERLWVCAFVLAGASLVLLGASLEASRRRRHV